MKKMLLTLAVPFLLVMGTQSADASSFTFKRAFRPVIGGQTRAFDSIAMDHNTGNIYVKEKGTAAAPITIHKFDHYGNFISTSTISLASLGLIANGEEFDLDVVAKRSASTTYNIGGNAVGEGKIILTNGEYTEGVFVLDDAKTNTSNEITYTGISQTFSSNTSRTGGSYNYETDVFYTLDDLGSDFIRGNDLSTGTLTGPSIHTYSGLPNMAPPNPNLPYNVSFEGDVAVHQQTGNLYVVSAYQDNTMIRVLSSTGTWIQDIEVSTIIAGHTGNDGGLDITLGGQEARGMSGIAVEPYGWDGEVNFYFGQYTTDEDIWLVTKQGWIIHFETPLPPPPEIPEPSTLALLGLGSIALVVYRRRQQKQA